MTQQARVGIQMTEYIFQFVPSESTTQDYDIIADGESILKVVSKAGGITALKLSQQRRLEFSEIGSIRYIVEIGDRNEFEFSQLFDSAKIIIEEQLQTDISCYRVCLLISGKNSIQSYLDEKSKIQTFGEKELNCHTPSYTELNDNTVKLSFGQRQICVP
jgi:hypothetical protein